MAKGKTGEDSEKGPLTWRKRAAGRAKRDLLEWADEEEPGNRAEDGHEAGEEQSVNEGAGMLDEEAGDDRSGDAGEIADKVLQAGPAARSARTGENLRNDPGVGNIEAVRGGGEEKKWDGVAGAGKSAGGEGESTDGLATSNHGFTNECDAAAAVDEAIGSETAGESHDGHEGVSERADFPHARERKLTVVNEIVGQPGEQKI